MVTSSTSFGFFDQGQLFSKKIITQAPSTRIRILLNPQLFLSEFTNIYVHTCPSTRIRHFVPRQQSMRRKAREICILLCLGL